MFRCLPSVVCLFTEGRKIFNDFYIAVLLPDIPMVHWLTMPVAKIVLYRLDQSKTMHIYQVMWALIIRTWQYVHSASTFLNSRICCFLRMKTATQWTLWCSNTCNIFMYLCREITCCHTTSTPLHHMYIICMWFKGPK